MKTLREIPIGQTVMVKKLEGEGALKRRIMDMGITKGTQIYVRKVAPLGDRWRSRCGAMSFPSAKGTRPTSWWSNT